MRVGDRVYCYKTLRTMRSIGYKLFTEGKYYEIIDIGVRHELDMDVDRHTLITNNNGEHTFYGCVDGYFTKEPLQPNRKIRKHIMMNITYL